MIEAAELIAEDKLKKAEPILRDYLKDDPFCFRYVDGVGNIEINKLVDHHINSKKLATLTAVQPPGRYGALELSGNSVKSFQEKPLGDNAWINGGFFILEPKVLSYIKSDKTFFEKQPLESLSKKGQLMAFKHKKTWQCMDTIRDKEVLESLWESGEKPWIKK